MKEYTKPTRIDNPLIPPTQPPPRRRASDGDARPPRYVKVDAWQALVRHANAYERHQRDEQRNADRRAA
jgi:hypothetical protein